MEPYEGGGNVSLHCIISDSLSKTFGISSLSFKGQLGSAARPLSRVRDPLAAVWGVGSRVISYPVTTKGQLPKPYVVSNA